MRRMLLRLRDLALPLLATATVVVGVLPAPVASGQGVPSATLAPVATATPTLVGTATASASATASPTATPIASATSTATPQPTVTAGATGTSTAKATTLSTRTATATFAATPSPTPATPSPAPSPPVTAKASGSVGGRTAATGPPGPLTSLAAGFVHTCGLEAVGAARCWGANWVGQLGNGTTTSQNAPVAVAGGRAFASLVAGTLHTCGLETSGDAWCWGSNSSGQLGDGTVASQSAPVAVSGGRKFASLVAGGYHTCGLEADGVAWCWGNNSSGQLGDGTTTGQSAPVAVLGDRKFASLVGGGTSPSIRAHTCGLEAGGVAWCWGNNSSGQLGDGTVTDRSAPVTVSGGRKFASIAAGESHSCGLEADGVAWCWGGNSLGQLGDGTATDRSSPATVSGGRKFASLGAGGYHTCGLEAGGAAWCWGRNVYGALGDGTTTDQSAPVVVSRGLAFASIAAGGHTCGIVIGGGAWCWGGNNYGQLGDGTQVNRSLPTTVVGQPAPVIALPSPGRAVFTSLAAGNAHACGLTGAGKAYCWGDNSSGQLGTGSSGANRVTPVPVGGDLAFSSITAGGHHTCGLISSGDAWCWGGNDLGQVGDGTRGTGGNDHSADRASPVAVTGGLAFSSLSAGFSSTCGLTRTGAAYCWGSPLGGATPQPVGGNVTFASITAGYSHACALTAARAAWCWGNNWAGKLGDGTTPASSSGHDIASATPVEVGGGKAFATVAAGDSHTCGVTTDGDAYCWGWNGSGQLGDDTTINRPSPVAVMAGAGLKFTRVVPGTFHTCGLATTGASYCWGGNDSGQLGDGTTTRRVVPVLAGGGLAFASLVSGTGHACGIATTGGALCWGANGNGQVGDGSAGTGYNDHAADRLSPVTVDVSAVVVPTAIRTIRVADVRDTSFTVSWVTDVPATGAIRWGLDDGTAPDNVAPDKRGASGTFTVHLATVSGLAPSTRYRFDVTSGPATDANGGAHYLVTTGPTLAVVPSPDQSHGTVSRRDGGIPDGVLVHVTASGPSGTSARLVTTAVAREWAANLGNLRTAALDAAFPVTDATVLAITADGGADGTAGAGTTVATARAGTLALALGDQSDVPLASGWNLVALRVAPSPAVSASGACALTNARAPGSVTEVVRWIAGAWESHRCGLPPNDFALEPGAGYFLRMTSPAAWPTWGTPVATAATRTLGAGWNLVGASATSGTPTTAPGACTVLNGAQAGSALEVVRWIDGGWEAHSCGSQTNRFTLQAGLGYFVRMATGGTLAPTGSAPVSAASARR